MTPPLLDQRLPQSENKIYKLVTAHSVEAPDFLEDHEVIRRIGYGTQKINPLVYKFH